MLHSSLAGLRDASHYHVTCELSYVRWATFVYKSLQPDRVLDDVFVAYHLGLATQ